MDGAVNLTYGAFMAVYVAIYFVGAISEKLLRRAGRGYAWVWQAACTVIAIAAFLAFSK